MASRRRSPPLRRGADFSRDDFYAQRARAEGFRSRAAYKLLQIDARDALFRRGMTAADLGCAPGGWSQAAAKKIGGGGKIVAVDLSLMHPIPGVAFVRGDFCDAEVQSQIDRALGGAKLDLVMCDMSPHISGVRARDQANASALALAALAFCRKRLAVGGDFLVKIFDGEDAAELKAAIAESFERIVVRNPAASRAASRESYLLAKRRKTP